MGRRQAVRHRVLVPTSGGSNPSAPVEPDGIKTTEALITDLKNPRYPQFYQNYLKQKFYHGT